MMCSYKTCFSYSLSLLQKTQRRRGNLDQDLIQGKLRFPKQLIHLLLFPLLSSIRYSTRSVPQISEMQRHTASSEWEGTLFGREEEDTRLLLSGGDIRHLGMGKKPSASSGTKAQCAEQTPLALSPVTHLCSVWNNAQLRPPATTMVQILQSKKLQQSERDTHGAE